MEALEPYKTIPPLEQYNKPFILGYEVGNATEEYPISIVLSTHGLLENARRQASLFPSFMQCDTTYKVVKSEVLKLGYSLTIDL